VIRLYIDEDAMDQDLVRALRVRGMDVITIGEQMQRILRISAERTSAAMRNRIEFLSAW
jgi:hypothetical protein